MSHCLHDFLVGMASSSQKHNNINNTIENLSIISCCFLTLDTFSATALSNWRLIVVTFWQSLRYKTACLWTVFAWCFERKLLASFYRLAWVPDEEKAGSTRPTFPETLFAKHGKQNNTVYQPLVNTPTIYGNHTILSRNSKIFYDERSPCILKPMVESKLLTEECLLNYWTSGRLMYRWIGNVG